MALDESTFNIKTIDKLNNLRKKYDELVIKLTDINVINDMNLNKQYSKEMSSIEGVVQKYTEYRELLKQYSESEEMIKIEKDKELIELAKEELLEIENQFTKVVEELRILLIPPDPLAEKNIIVEIRAGTGGDEAALFCGDLFRMYSRYAEKKNWKIEVIDYNDTTGVGGYKEIIFSIFGKKVYENMRFEYGGNRVQTIPATASKVSVHT